MADFSVALPIILQQEGGYSNVPGDSGGPTNFGITQTVAQDNGYDGDMEDFTVDQAASIYQSQYWDSWSLSDLTSQNIATAIFSLHVNMGGNAAGVVQDALNSLGAGVTRDNAWGPATRAAVNAADPVKLLAAISASAAAYYTRLAQTNPNDAQFLDGWLNRAEALGQLALDNPLATGGGLVLLLALGAVLFLRGGKA